MNKKIKQWVLLFRISFMISIFAFGGGYVVIPLMRKFFVKDLSLIDDAELLDIAAIAQSTPGAIAVNTAVLVGYRIAGIVGAVICCVGTVLPPLMILSVISLFYKAFRANRVVSAVLRGMEAGVAASIVDILIDMWRGITKEKNLLMSLLVPAAFIANFVFKLNVLLILAVCSALCFAQGFIAARKEKNDG